LDDEAEMARLPLPDKAVETNTLEVATYPISIPEEPSSEEFDDGYLELLSSDFHALASSVTNITSPTGGDALLPEARLVTIVGDDFPSIHHVPHRISTYTQDGQPHGALFPTSPSKERPAGGSAEYSPSSIFAGPNFPPRVIDRSPIVGVSASMVLRTCFRVGELIREDGYCEGLGQDAIIELFARISSSSREAGTSKQLFRFADLFHDHPPHPNGVLENCRAYGLQETESRRLLGPEGIGQMVRCLGRWKRMAVGTGWLFHIINIRTTDWEEVRWTKGIAGAGMAARASKL
jgi:hypothetical protein